MCGVIAQGRPSKSAAVAASGPGALAAGHRVAADVAGQQVLVGVVRDLLQRQALHAADVGDHSPALEGLDDGLGDVVGGYGDHGQLRGPLGRRRDAGPETAGRAHVLVVEVGEPDLEAGAARGQADGGAQQARADDVDGPDQRRWPRLTHPGRPAPG